MFGFLRSGRLFLRNRRSAFLLKLPQVKLMSGVCGEKQAFSFRCKDCFPFATEPPFASDVSFVCLERRLCLPPAETLLASGRSSICFQWKLCLPPAKAPFAFNERCVCFRRKLSLPLNGSSACLRQKLHLPFNGNCVCFGQKLCLPPMEALFAFNERCVCFGRKLRLLREAVLLVSTDNPDRVKTFIYRLLSLPVFPSPAGRILLRAMRLQGFLRPTRTAGATRQRSRAR